MWHKSTDRHFKTKDIEVPHIHLRLTTKDEEQNRVLWTIYTNDPYYEPILSFWKSMDTPVAAILEQASVVVVKYINNLSDKWQKAKKFVNERQYDVFL
jgi:hypothetical protein